MKPKRISLLLFFLVVICFAAKAQVINNLVVFCNDSRFTLILNGLKENDAPLTNVRVEGLDLKVYEVKVIFENKKLKDHGTTLTFYRTGKECVFALNKHGKKHTLDYVSEKDMDGFLPPVINQIPVNNEPTDNNINSNPQIQTTNTTTVNNPVSTETQLQTTIKNIVAQPTEEGKLKTGLASLENTTFSVAQIKQIFTLFSSEQSRLAFAKQVCLKVKDPSTYTSLLDAFINEAIKQEFKKFIAGKK